LPGQPDQPADNEDRKSGGLKTDISGQFKHYLEGPKNLKNLVLLWIKKRKHKHFDEVMFIFSISS
jgi:hypothetical protein